MRSDGLLKGILEVTGRGTRETVGIVQARIKTKKCGKTKRCGKTERGAKTKRIGRIGLVVTMKIFSNAPSGVNLTYCLAYILSMYMVISYIYDL